MRRSRNPFPVGAAAALMLTSESWQSDAAGSISFFVFFLFFLPSLSAPDRILIQTVAIWLGSGRRRRRSEAPEEPEEPEEEHSDWASSPRITWHIYLALCLQHPAEKTRQNPCVGVSFLLNLRMLSLWKGTRTRTRLRVDLCSSGHERPGLIGLWLSGDQRRTREQTASRK